MDPAPQASGRRPIRDAADVAALAAADYDSVVPVRSTYELLSRSAVLHGARRAIVYLPDGTAGDEAAVLSFDALLEAVNRAANLFRSLGVGRDDTVALLLPPMPETVVAFLAAQAAGRVMPLNYMLSADHIAELIAHAGASVVVALGPDPAFPIWDKVPAIRRLVARPLHVVRVGAEDGPDAFSTLMAAQPAEPSFEIDVDRDAIAACFHTGGSTGVPKLVLHSHRNQVHVAWFAGLMYDVGPDDLFLNGFPFFHVAGSIVLAAAAIAAGAGTLIPSRLGMRNKAFVRDYWTIVERHGVTVLSGGPTFVSTLLAQHPDVRGVQGIKALYGGGSPMPGELAARFEDRFGVPIRSIYGMTEAAGMIATVPRHAARRPGSSGWPLPHCEVRVFAVDGEGRPDPERPLAAGTAGALAVRGPNVTPGYVNAALNASAFLPGGWLATGDTGRIDPDGQVVVLGRSKDVIIRGGHNIDPLVIEEALMHHPDVELCAAVGEPDRHAGELPVAFLKLKPGRSATPDEILERVRGHIPEPAAVPKRIYLMDEMPLTTTGKVFKPALRQAATERVLMRDLSALLPEGRIRDVACREEQGQRKVLIRLDPPGHEESRRIVVEHMSMLALAFDFASG